MPSRRRQRWDLVTVAALSSTAFHAFVVVPKVVMPLMERREAPVEVSFLDESAAGSDDAPGEAGKKDPLPDEKRAKADAAKRKAKAKDEAPKAKPPEVAQLDEKAKPPAPLPVVPVKPPPPPPPAPAQRMKAVDQERADDEPDNADAHYLAQSNHRAKEETRTLATNLVRNAEGAAEAPSAPSENQMPNVGMPKQKTAELEEQKGVEHRVVRGKPLRGDEGEAAQPPRPGKLSMRGLMPQAAEPVAGDRPREGVELKQPGVGELPMPRVGDGGERGQVASKGGNQIRLQLTHEDYDRIEGEGVADKQRGEAARAEVSHPQGRWARTQQKLAAMRSSLENFTPEVKVGNQAELGTRAHPFAAYIAQMHRGIHKLWADGFIGDVEGKGVMDPLNNLQLWTQLEIVLRGDGSLAKAPMIVRPSGYAPFDAAAIDTVMSAAPYPPPPASIKSANGKVYLDWRFHRDDRLCGTLGVDPHILTDPGENEKHDTSEVGKVGQGPAPAGAARPRLLASAAGGAAPFARFAPAPEPPPSVSPPAPEPASGPAVESTVPDAAREAADGWFSAYVRGDAGWLAGWSATPFSAGGQIAAKDAAAVKQMYTALLDEAAADRRLDDLVTVLTPSGARARLGALPPGGDDETLFAVGQVGREQLVLLLKESRAGWRVRGLDR